MNQVLNKKAKVLLINPVQGLRMSLRSTIEGYGFDDVAIGSDWSDVKKFLKHNKSGWIVMPPYAEAKENGLTLLKEISRTKALHELRISLIVNEDEMDILPEAFELGLLSYIAGPLNPSKIEQEIAFIVEAAEKYDGQGLLVAAAYLRRYLAHSKDYHSLMALEHNLLKLLPADPDILFHVGKAFLGLEKPEQAKAFFRQAVYLAPEILAEIDAYLREEGLA